MSQFVRDEVEISTFAGLLRMRAAERRDQVAFTFLAEGETEAGRLTYGDLDRKALAIASTLRETVSPGERALLLYPPGLDFIEAFFGCLYAGVVAVPAYPPRPNERSQSRLRSIVRDAEPLAVLTTSDGLAGSSRLAPELAALRWIATDVVETPGDLLPEPDPESVAFLQYTSGSTADPKGVMVTHASLLHNERMIGEAFGMDEGSVVVGWLPLYHDMGLIGNVLQPIHAGARCVLMSPVSFLQRPLRWLEAISRYRGTTSGGPNFAYELCLRKAGPEDIAGLDLSSWRVAFNGAEPVRASTLERFAETFAPCGFRPEAFYPCYGLAEATLFVTGGEPASGPRIEGSRVSCGHAWMGQRLAVADPETGAELPSGTEGEIWIAGPSVARGYWKNAAATARDFNAFLETGEGPFLRTGDLGVLDTAENGELFVTGRIKDLIILRGRNLYPQDLELTAERSHPDLRPGGGAAFSVDIAGEERLVVVHEVERRRREGFEEVAEAVRRAVAAEHEAQVWEVVLIRQGGLPKTSSGKVQRRLCRELYLSGGLPVVSRSALAAAGPEVESALVLTRDGLAALEPGERRPTLAAYLRERAAAVLGVPASSIPLDRSLTGLGLDSLSAVELKGSVEAELGLAISLSGLLQGIGIGELAGLLLEETPADATPPRALSLTGDQPLSPGQKALWFLERLAPEAGAYNVVAAARVHGSLDVEALRRALSTLMARHEALRTVIRAMDGEPVQRTVDGLEPDVAVICGHEGSLEAEAWRPFDLETGPPLRVRVFQDAGETTLLLAVHHLVSDFWSLAVMARELGALYGGEVLESPALQYSDFVRWQADHLAARGEELRTWWSEALAGVRDLDLPTDRPRPSVQTWRGGSRSLRLPPELVAGVRSLAASREATLFMALLAGFEVLLGRTARQDDFAVGTPTSGRGVRELDGVMGYFVNPVALRSGLAGGPAFQELLERVRRTALAGLEHAGLPFPWVAERLRPARDPARPPVFQVMLVLQQGRAQDDPGLAAFGLGEDGARVALGGGLLLESVRIPERRVQFELSLGAAESPEGGLLLSLEHDAGLFDPATAERMLRRYRTLLAAAVADPARPVDELAWLEEAERRQLLEWSVAPPVAEPRQALHELVFDWVERTPEAPAVVYEEETLTYGELGARALRLAGTLRALGAGPETLVGLFAERSPELVAGILGVLAAGAAWMPLDPTYPRERLAVMIEDGAPPVVLAQRCRVGELPGLPGLPGVNGANGARVLVLEDVLEGGEALGRPMAADGRQVACVIFTSGSTGRPKGVAVPHRALANRMLRAREAFAIGPADAMLQRAPIGFDASVWETFGALVAGGRVVLSRVDGPRDPAYLVGLIAAAGVTLVDITPSVLDVILDQEGLEERTATLRIVWVGAEATSAALVERYRARVRAPLFNTYGPTEAAVDLVWHRFRPEVDGATAPIGRPIEGCAAYVLDGLLEPVPAGVPGELWLGGIALARGYMDRPDLTADAFRPHPFGDLGDGERLYRTGDLVRWRKDGVLEFLGRVDEQVKIRGIRVEPGEAEAALRRLPGVREAAVVAVRDGAGVRLAAFLVADPAPDVRELRAALAASLPEAFIPSVFVPVPELPRTPSGKVDRRALARTAPATAGPVSGDGYAVPRTPDEELLAGIWAGLLGVERVGAHDDFFALGGHSLLATRVVAQVSRVFGVDLPVSAVFQAPTVAGLAERIAATASQSSAPPVRPAPRAPGEALPLSFAQRRLWFLEQLEPGAAVYNVPGEVRLAGPLDVPALAAALGEIARRHEALRTVFFVRDGEPVQQVGSSAIVLPVVDLSAMSAMSAISAKLVAAETERWAAAEARQPFDLARGPVWRALLLRLGHREHRLLVTFHHIASDGWSVGLFLDELSALYGGQTLPELPVQYPDFAVWQREQLHAEGQLEYSLKYWRERLKGLPVLELPSDRPRPAVRDPRGAVRSLALPPETAAAVAQLARREGVTLFMALLGAFQALLARLTEESVIPVGSPVANRRRPEVEGLIGVFVNTLVLDARLGDDPALSDFLGRVRETSLAAYAHQDLPFERLVEELAPSRTLAQNPLFQMVLVLEEPLPARAAGTLVLEPVRRHSGTAKFDLVLAVSPRADGGWDALAEYAAALFEPVTVDRLLGHWRTLLEGMASTNPSTRLSELPLLTAAERQQVFAEWNDTGAAFPSGLRLHDLVAVQAARTPDAVAVVGERERLTYRELMERGGRLARFLRGMGVGPEVRVGLCMERTPDLIAAILGILQAGGAYLPLDPAYPQERLELMLDDAGAALLLTQSAYAARMASFAGPTVLLDDFLNTDRERIENVPEAEGTEPADGNLAYVIYTSGSTGRPKGVAIEHHSAVTLVHWGLAAFSPEDLAVSLASTSVCFDISIFEIFVPLAAGGRLILVPNVLRLPALAATEDISIVNAVPSPMAELVGGRLPGRMRVVNLGGEALKADLVERIYAHPQVERVYNLYGPSEDTTYSTVERVRRGDPQVTIGRPISNTRAWVLGRHGELLPAGVPGELFLSGGGLSRGYLGRPDVTADRFVPDPFGPPGSRMYRTGDRVRLLPDGRLDFLGRLDHQVKLHGIRIELGEIEACLEQHPKVRQAVAVVEGEIARLVGYVVPEEGAGEDLGELGVELAGYLRGLLPAIMVPTAWMVLPAFPLSPNGKVDRRALPAPSRSGHAGSAAPRNPAEESLAAIFREVLGLEEIGIHDDFFELGGHSLMAIRAAFRAAETFGVEVPVSVLFQSPTVAGLAGWLEQARPAIQETVEAAPEGPYPLSFAQQRLWLIDRLEPGSALYNVSTPLRLEGRLDVALLGRTLAEIVRRHEPLRTVYSQSDGEPVQTVLPPSPAPLPLLSLAGLPEPAHQAALREVLQEEALLPFDLERGPVVRFLLVELGGEEHVLAATFHHIATDGWSMGVFSREMTAFYEAFAAGRPSPLPELPLRYVDYALAERQSLAGGALERQLDYWRGQLAGLPVLELPGDRPRPARPSSRGASLRIDLPYVGALGRAEGITPFVVQLAGFAALLSRLSGQDDFGIGVPSAGRSRAETEGMIGFFVNTLVLRPGLQGDPSFLDLARRVRDTAFAAQAHQDVPFERLVEELQPDRSSGASPLFQVMLAFLSDPEAGLRIPGLSVSLVEMTATLARFDLGISIHEWEGRLRGWLLYRTDLFEAATIERMAGWLGTLLAGAAANPNRRLYDLPLLTAAEEMVLRRGDGEVVESVDLAIHRAFEEQARAMPHALAVIWGEESLTRGDLNARANRLARHLLALGLAPEDRVAVCLEQSSPDLITAVFAVLKAGGTYVPIDPGYPAERMRFVLEDCGAAVLISHGRLLDRLPVSNETVLVLLDTDAIAFQEGTDPGVEVDPRALAYIIYTSGSTGRPKGVGIPHGAAARHFATLGPVYGLAGGDRVMQFASPGFDVSIEQLMAHPGLGATLVLRPEGPVGTVEYTRAVFERGITFANLPTAFWHRWAADCAGVPASVRTALVGGEEMLAGSVRQWLDSPLAGIRLLNGYGPTETIVTATIREVRPEDGEGGPVSIGRPFPGRSGWVLDRRGNLVPQGVPGELCLAGPLARGYLGRPDLTAERFVPDPFSGRPGARLYRTGDRVRRRPDGDLEFMGRLDEQVKIRGVRIEPGEIEAALTAHPGVREAAVAVLKNSVLAAYVVLVGDTKKESLRAFLRERLPDAMVPTAWAVLPSLPINAHGKVDRNALPPVVMEEDGGQDVPATPEGELLAGLFADLLGRERVGAEEDFFDLGGHSLLATQLVSRVRAVFGVELPLAAVFERPTPAGLAGLLETARRAPRAAPPPLTREESAAAPLSFPQQRLWFLHQLDPDDAYHVPGALRLRGPLREDVLERALGEIVRRHESLRTVFRTEGTVPVQVVLPQADLPLPVVDLSVGSDGSVGSEAGWLLAAEARRPFDLETGPLVRVLLLRLSEEDRLLAVVTHHIVSDAWSLGVLLRELGALYTAFAAGEPSPLPELPVQYPDFARWQRRWLAGEVLEREVAHWRRALSGVPESLELPYDRPPAAGTGTRGGRRPFELSAGLFGGLVELGRRDGWTAFMALLAGFGALLSRYGSQEDVVVGSPIANRNRLEIEGLIGFFTNTLALRLDLSGDPSFWDLGRRVRAAALDAYTHQDLPFEKLVEELAPDRHLGHNPLFQTMLVLQKAPIELTLAGVETGLLDVDTGTSKFDLTLMLIEGEGGAAGAMEYAAELFDAATVDRLLGHLRTLLQGAVEAPGRRLSDLPILTGEEREELIAWSRPLRPEPPALLVHEGVMAQAARTPDAVAVIHGEESLTYGELAARARRLARRLRALGVGPDMSVGLYLERSLDMMVAILGVLEAGGAYLPLDPSYPAERLKLMLEDAHAPVLVTHGPLAGSVPAGAGQAVRVDDLRDEDDGPLPPSGVEPDHLAYVIYTSGSTGRPKGVAMTHGAITAMLLWQLRTSAAGGGRTLQLTSLSFDVSFQEIFSAWWAGGALVLVSEEVRRDPAALVRLMAEERVERLFLPFVALQQVATSAIGDGVLPSSLREVLSAGEQLHVTPQVAELFSRLPGAELHNHYGPSETHAVTWLALEGDPSGWPERPAIGLSVDHARAFLLDSDLQPVPVGVPGEVWVGGAGLARGYLGRPDLTAERFLPDPFDWAGGWRPGDRLYRTGDLARRRPDGILEFLGRADSQVKIRGHRVELFEVEAALARHPAVLQAAVAARGETSGARRLVAYVVLREDVPSPAFGELRAFLAESLPDPMVPTAWARIEALPLTATGKLDRRALARIEPEAGEPSTGPRTPAEELLAGIWSEVLGIEKVSIHDDFFELGGHSLLATQVASRIRETFGASLPLRRIFEASSLAAMAAAVLDSEATTAAPPIRPVPREGDLPLSFAQERLWFLHRLQPDSGAYSVPLALTAEGRLDVPRLAAALSAVVRRHEVLRTVFAERDGEPVQVVLPASSLPMPMVDLRGLPADRRETEAGWIGATEAARPFDLAHGPLLRAVLLALAPEQSPERSQVLLNLHHIVTDGWSMGVLVREVQALYAGSPLPEPRVQYADFAVWQRRWLAGETLERQLSWWRERLHGANLVLELPADHPRPPLLSQHGAEHPFFLDGELSRAISGLARREGVTPFMVLAAGLFVLLSRLTGQRDLAIGSPIANRNHLETEELIGFFVNTLVLRADLSRAVSFRDLLRQVREASLGAYAHQDLPFEKLVDELHPDRDLSRSPLFQVALALQNAPLPKTVLDGVRLKAEELSAGVAKFDLSFVFFETGEGRLAGMLQYATDLFEAPTAMRYARHLAILLEGLAAQPRGRLAEVSLLAAEERHQVLREWNDTRLPVRDLTLHGLFEARADLQPGALAAVWEGSALTYGELEERANRLAWLLRDVGGAGVKTGTPVGIWMERSLDMVVAVLGILKAGGHYLPLDASWPAERAEAVLAGSRTPVVVTRAALLPAVQEIQWRLPLAGVVCLDAAGPEAPAEPVDASGVLALWNFVAERAVDRETAGGFVSSYTGQAFSAAEVDEYRDRVLALAAPWLRPDARVLEIGCGAGLILWEMAPRVAHAVGLDPSALTQERNRAYAAEHGHGNVELLTGFAHEIGDLPEGAFDLVLLASTVQFFPGPVYLEKVVGQALKRLAPGGALLIADVPDARRQADFRRSLTAGTAGTAQGKILWLDEDLFRDLGGEVHHRSEGFDNELRFRYDVLMTAGPPRKRRKRLWTGWHVERQPAERLPAAASPDDLAYVIHTSGSTGAPKGIGVQHRPAVGVVDWVNETFGVGPADRLLFVTSLGFDLSVYDVLGVLAAGGTVHIAPESALRDPERLAAMLREEPITFWDSAPAALQQLASRFPTPGEPGEAVFHPLRLVMLSGDWVPVRLPDQVRAAFPAARVMALGGATEATVWSNWYPVGEVDPRWPSIPYGRPIANARYHVLDESFLPCPVGVPGDLYIGGSVLSVGYVYQPDLTAERFLPDPFAERPGDRLYRTGDRARYGADGNLEFLGRVDHQVKIRGYRIELGDIEVALVRHPAVRQAVVLAREDAAGEKRLVAYTVPPGVPPPAGPTLRAFLLESLPEYMVPWDYVELEALPVTANGKLDREALPAPRDANGGGNGRARGPYVAPRNDLERAIGAVWCEVLQLDRVGVRDSFFEIGGSSLLLGRLQSRLAQELGREIPYVELFRHPTIESLARELAGTEEAPSPEARAGEVRERARTRQESMRQLRESRTRKGKQP